MLAPPRVTPPEDFSCTLTKDFDIEGVTTIKSGTLHIYTNCIDYSAGERVMLIEETEPTLSLVDYKGQHISVSLFGVLQDAL